MDVYEFISKHMLDCAEEVILYSADVDTREIHCESLFRGAGNVAMFTAYANCRITFVRSYDSIIALYLSPKDIAECIKGTGDY